MKLNISHLFIVGLLLVRAAYCQDGMYSESAKALGERIKVGDYQSILDTGKTNDRTLIPFLKTLTGKGTPWAQMALARLGEENYLNQILAEVDAASPDVQDRAMEKLVYVGGKAAFRKLHQLLDDTSPRVNPSCKIQTEEFRKTHADGKECGLCCDVIFFSRSSTAILFLSKMIENPPTKAGIAGTQKDIAIWQEWFSLNKFLID